jgi:beta-lactamase class A
MTTDKNRISIHTIHAWFTSKVTDKAKIILFGVGMLVVGMGVGVMLSKVYVDAKQSDTAGTQLRLSGQRFTSPLLACDRTLKPKSQELASVQSEVEKIITQSQSTDAISTASVYVRLLETGDEFLINREEHYFPASLRKLPLFMQYLSEAESEPNLLTTKRKLEASSSANLGVIIPPKLSPQPNKEYSVQELLEMMIRYSDNVSFQVLYAALGEERFQKMYDAMQLAYPNDFKALIDHRTPLDYALFFRTLYNATYLSVDHSEQALQLLTETDYVRGLVKYLPPEVKVAHKFGVAALEDASGKQYGELHDCGIVYKSESPYVICVMTKSYSPQIEQVEEVIANISASVYENLD